MKSDWRQFPTPSTQSKIYWQTEKSITKIYFCNKSNLCWPMKTVIESKLWKKIIFYRMLQLCQAFRVDSNLSGYFFQQWTQWWGKACHLNSRNRNTVHRTQPPKRIYLLPYAVSDINIRMTNIPSGLLRKGSFGELKPFAPSIDFAHAL